MIFPTEAEITFFTSEEAKRIQEEWEPKFGHWVLDGNDNIGIVNYWDDAHGGLYIKYPGHIRGAWYSRVSCILLPRLDQLLEMLEERGIDWELSGGLAKIRLPGQGWADEELIVHRAPTPSIALGKCLLEALSVQHPEGKEE